ncbi:PspC domain-containing protein [Microbacterium sp. H1-D42]|uniref:PspC domain-containing protein n=1 Tax=Microbacterium sp. H1-D42 TaxID=2925844 RepID=UPI001F52EFF6|nr:PspC domain-containing protein [Microbacterium sp. H1-D42]UNK71557.1 PspC domain-containing protein [Microbacterium sp. H1-D42]
MTIPTAPPSGDNRFFSWVAGLGIARSEGWIGGVAAGIAARLRIDPLIVRGILVVATLCGLPLILLYAIAWALLPDAEGRIHARTLVHGHYEPAQLGILAGVVIGLMTLWPLSALSLFFRIVTGPYNGYDYGFGGPSGLSIFGFFLGLALVIVLLVFIVRAARRTPGGSPTDPRTASAATVAPVSFVSAGDSGIAAETDGRGADAGGIAFAAMMASAPALERPAEPAEPAQPSDPSDLGAWREQHAAWQQQERAWRDQQQDADRVAREQARREREETAAAFSAEAAERRRVRRDSKPRASFAYVATAIGLALVTGAVVWLWSQTPDAVTVGLALFSASLVLALGMIITGIARRRSGFLAFVTAVTLFGAMIAGIGATVGDVRFGQVQLSNAAPVDLRQPFGFTALWLYPFEEGRSEPITVHKGEGFTQINVDQGVQLDLTATIGDDVSVNWTQVALHADGSSEPGDSGTWTGRPLGDGTNIIHESVTSANDPTAETTVITRAPVTIDQDSGTIYVTYYVRADEETSE